MSKVFKLIDQVPVDKLDQRHIVNLFSCLNLCFIRLLCSKGHKINPRLFKTLYYNVTQIKIIILIFMILLIT